MGFKLKRRYIITFDAGHALHGLEVTCRGMPAGDILTIQESIESAKDSKDRISLAQDFLVQVIKDWNALDDDEIRIQPGRQAIEDLELDQLIDIVQAYFRATIGVSRPLKEDSSNGSPSELESLTMEISPASHQSFDEQS